MSRGRFSSWLCVAWFLGCSSPIDVVAVPRLTSNDAGEDAQVGGSAACVLAASQGFAGIDVARSAVRDQALCVCQDLVASKALTVSGGDVGIRGQLSAIAPVQVSGSLVVASDKGIVLTGADELRVGELQSAGPVLGSSAGVYVATDASIAGRVQLDAFEIGASFVRPAGTQVDVTQGVVASAIRSEQVIVSPPCSCNNGLASIAADVDLSQLPTVRDGARLSDQCALVQLDTSGASQLRLVADASVVILVPGDLSLDGSMVVEAANDAVVTLVVLGNVRANSPIMLGTQGGGRVELMVQGSGTVDIAGGSLVGSFYAPSAELVLQGSLSVEGNVLIRRSAIGGNLEIRTP